MTPDTKPIFHGDFSRTPLRRPGHARAIAAYSWKGSRYLQIELVEHGRALGGSQIKPTDAPIIDRALVAARARPFVREDCGTFEDGRYSIDVRVGHHPEGGVAIFFQKIKSTGGAAGRPTVLYGHEIDALADALDWIAESKGKRNHVISSGKIPEHPSFPRRPDRTSERESEREPRPKIAPRITLLRPRCTQVISRSDEQIRITRVREGKPVGGLIFSREDIHILEHAVRATYSTPEGEPARNIGRSFRGTRGSYIEVAACKWTLLFRLRNHLKQIRTSVVLEGDEVTMFAVCLALFRKGDPIK